jgi:hypothetical protein
MASSLQFDIALFENNNGGDVLVKGNDLAKYYENEGQVYLALFGGNVEEDTPTVIVPGKEKNYFWGNAFLNSENQFNSKTERALKNVSLSSQGRATLQSAVEYDLSYLKKYANIDVQVAIIGQNKITIKIFTTYFTGKKTLTTLTYSFLNTDGDFSLLDFVITDFV